MTQGSIAASVAVKIGRANADLLCGNQSDIAQEVLVGTVPTILRSTRFLSFMLCLLVLKHLTLGAKSSN